MSIPGSEYLTIVLHAIAQSFLIPVVVGLLLMILIVFMELGNFIAERQKRKEAKQVDLVEIFSDVKENLPWQKNNIYQVIENNGLTQRQKDLIYDFMSKENIGKSSRKILARDILDQEEFRMKKTLDKTDLITKLGPVLGLMGTLIPLGPGLAHLGQGDVVGLSEAVIIAFDTTVVGVAVGAIASLISKIRRRWYEKDINRMEVLLELIEGDEEIVEQEEKKNTVRRTGN
ncbi:MotA/TolQ/ExbB proton channel family protein [Crassaminicella thermophila]|uniref:MotA/TolQ/ExbB proton channel family protein n=1 Tax=Crassaminicella thermophila TaxID=2599308 RepID=A0A5C0SG80_CRATE|nr:MotA/TolQ/ExbB proton channel family protein [Crassaminicella thermophila]QEK12942.1 MotA/TolQ/ExbB proton channel family protein [Crassaminicella thermophila]